MKNQTITITAFEFNKKTHGNVRTYVMQLEMRKEAKAKISAFVNRFDFPVSFSQILDEDENLIGFTLHIHHLITDEDAQKIEDRASAILARTKRAFLSHIPELNGERI